MISLAELRELVQFLHGHGYRLRSADGLCVEDAQPAPQQHDHPPAPEAEGRPENDREANLEMLLRSSDSPLKPHLLERAKVGGG